MDLNEAKQTLKDSGYICEEFEITNKDRRLESVGDLIDVLKGLPRTFSIKLRVGNTEDVNIGMIAQDLEGLKRIVLFPEEKF